MVSWAKPQELGVPFTAVLAGWATEGRRRGEGHVGDGNAGSVSEGIGPCVRVQAGSRGKAAWSALGAVLNGAGAVQSRPWAHDAPSPCPLAPTVSPCALVCAARFATAARPGQHFIGKHWVSDPDQAEAGTCRPPCASLLWGTAHPALAAPCGAARFVLALLFSSPRVTKCSFSVSTGSSQGLSLSASVSRNGPGGISAAGSAPGAGLGLLLPPMALRRLIWPQQSTEMK